MPELPPVYVHLLPAMIPDGSLGGGVAVVLDVLRATTVMIKALDSGCVSIVPCLEIAEAKAAASALPGGRALLGGERLGLPIEGFDLANSPGDYTPDACRGKTVIMTTTNGTRAIHAALGADRVLIAAFANLGATLRTLEGESRPIHVVCAGTNGMVSLEDTLLAGAIVEGLRPSHRPAGNDEAILAGLAWEGTRGRPLVDSLARGIGGRRVRAIGLDADLAFASEVDRFDLAAEVERDPPRIVRI